MRLLLLAAAVASALVAIATLVYVRAITIDGRESPIARPTSDNWTRTNATGLNAGPWSWTA